MPLFRVLWYVSEVDWHGPQMFRRARGVFTAMGPVLGCLQLGSLGRVLLLGTEGAFGVSIERDDTARSWHFKLEVGIMRDLVEASERCAP